MKLATITLLCQLIGVAAAWKGFRGRRRFSYYYGKNQAQKLWDDGVDDSLYNCNEHADVLEVFRADVEDDVYKTCKNRYKWWNRRVRACKNGADDFVVDKAAECHDPVDDCTALATAAAGGVASEFCEFYPENYALAQSIFPAGCIETARDKCKAQVLDEVQGIIMRGKEQGRRDCGSLDSIKDLTMDDREELRQSCDDEVEALAEEPI